MRVTNDITASLEPFPSDTWSSMDRVIDVLHSTGGLNTMTMLVLCSLWSDRPESELTGQVLNVRIKYIRVARNDSQMNERERIEAKDRLIAQEMDGRDCAENGQIWTTPVARKCSSE